MIGAVMEPDTIDEFRKSFSTDSLRSLVAGHVRDYGGDFLGKYESGERWINVRVLFDETLEPEEAVLCFREVDQEKRRQIQERRLLEETLATARKSEKSKLAFFNNMSHDMRTPSTPSWGWWTCCASTPPSRTRCGNTPTRSPTRAGSCWTW